jgi:hypothetical protein
MALLACKTTCFLQDKKDPELEKTTPRYLYSLTVSIG